MINRIGQIVDKKNRTNVIVSYLKRIDESEMPLKVFFEKHDVPFSLAQYYRYKKVYKRDGSQGLHDGRAQGNNRRLTPSAANFIQGIVLLIQTRN